MMAHRPYTVKELQLQLRECYAQLRIDQQSLNFQAIKDSRVIINELRALGRGDIVCLEERFDGLARLGYDAEQVIADVMAGRDPLTAQVTAQAERRRDIRFKVGAMWVLLAIRDCVYRARKAAARCWPKIK